MTNRYESLTDLVRAVPKFDDKHRAYAVTHGGKVEYVVSNSQGNAALEVCEVETVTQKQLLSAFADAVVQAKKPEAAKA